MVPHQSVQVHGSPRTWPTCVTLGPKACHSLRLHATQKTAHPESH